MNNYYYPGGFNPTTGFNTQRQIEELQREINRLSQLNASMYPQTQPQYRNYQPNITGNKQYETGVYVYVNDYQEVLDYPTPTDGSAVLFLCLDKGLGWSKKFTNGTSSIQALSVQFLNAYNDKDTTASEQSSNTSESTNNEDIMALLTNLADRLTALEGGK